MRKRMGFSHCRIRLHFSHGLSVFGRKWKRYLWFTKHVHAFTFWVFVLLMKGKLLFGILTLSFYPSGCSLMFWAHIKRIQTLHAKLSIEFFRLEFRLYYIWAMSHPSSTNIFLFEPFEKRRYFNLRTVHSLTYKYVYLRLKSEIRHAHRKSKTRKLKMVKTLHVYSHW